MWFPDGPFKKIRSEKWKLEPWPSIERRTSSTLRYRRNQTIISRSLSCGWPGSWLGMFAIWYMGTFSDFFCTSLATPILISLPHQLWLLLRFPWTLFWWPPTRKNWRRWVIFAQTVSMHHLIPNRLGRGCSPSWWRGRPLVWPLWHPHNYCPVTNPVFNITISAWTNTSTLYIHHTSSPFIRRYLLVYSAPLLDPEQ